MDKQQKLIGPSFALMALNYARVEEFKKMVPEMLLYEQDKFEWDDMIKLELHLASHYQHLFVEYKPVYLLGHKTVFWSHVYKALLKFYVSLEKKYQKQFDKNYQYYSSEEHTEIKTIIKKLHKIKTEKDFLTVLKNPFDYRSFDTDGFYPIKDLIFNYCVHNKIACELIDDDSEFTTELAPLNLPKVELLRQELTNYQQSVEQAVTLLLPHAKRAKLSNGSSGLHNFYSDVQRKIEKLL